jgi:OOP family OmpA-OmpF porin
MSNSLPDSKQPDGKTDGRQFVGRQMEELRDLLLGPEKEKIEQILGRLDDPDIRAREIGDILAQALRWRTAKDDQIARAIQPAIEETLHQSVRKNPKALVDAIFPVMGPALRKAISASIMGMIQSLNQLIDHSVSLRGIKWRIEALKTRKPFAEVVLLHTLLFRVEQIFLIHTETGLMVQHVAVDGIDYKDPDLISGMLTAIQDFIKESFNGQDGLIDTLRIGNQRSIWLEQGSRATLAAVIRGTPPLDYRSDLRECVDWIHLRFCESLAVFNGDTAPFDALFEELKGLLRFQLAEKPQKPSPLLWLLLAVLLALPMVYGVDRYQRNLAWRKYVEILKAEPGIIVTDTYKAHGQYVVEGLRDPLAKDPIHLMPRDHAAKIPVTGRWKVYHAMEDSFLLPRVRATLKPPPGITLTLSDGELTAKGTADHLWIRRARILASSLPGIAAYHDDTVVDLDLAAFHEAADQLEGIVFYFPNNKIEIKFGQDQKLDVVTNLALRLQTLGFENRISFEILILGHADIRGSQKLNLELSQLRAERIAELLISRGVKPVLFKTMGLSTNWANLEAQEESAQKETYRSVTFEVHLAPMS